MDCIPVFGSHPGFYLCSRKRLTWKALRSCPIFDSFKVHFSQTKDFRKPVITRQFPSGKGFKASSQLIICIYKHFSLLPTEQKYLPHLSTTPYATAFRRRFFIYHHAVKHPHTSPKMCRNNFENRFRNKNLMSKNVFE